MALPRFECSVKLGQYRFYTMHEDNYSSSFFMFIDGDWGHIVGLNGNSFLRYIGQFLIPIMDESELNFVTFTMLPPLLERLTPEIESVVDVREVRKFKRGSREFTFVEVSRKCLGSEAETNSQSTKEISTQG